MFQSQSSILTFQVLLFYLYKYRQKDHFEETAMNYHGKWNTPSSPPSFLPFTHLSLSISTISIPHIPNDNVASNVITISTSLPSFFIRNNLFIVLWQALEFDHLWRTRTSLGGSCLMVVVARSTPNTANHPAYVLFVWETSFLNYLRHAHLLLLRVKQHSFLRVIRLPPLLL